jgi:F0F1-type ATP synthase assembly protein I
MPDNNTNSSEFALGQMDKFQEELKTINQLISDMGDELGDNLVKQLSKSISEAKKLKDPLKDIESINRKITDLIEDNFINQNRLNIAEKNYAKALQEGNKDEQKRARDKVAQLSNSIIINEQLLLELQTLKEIAEIEESSLKQNEQKNKLANLLNKGIESLTEKYLSISAILKIILDSAFRFNKISVLTGKSLGYGASNSDRIAYNLVGIAETSSDINVTLKNLGEAMSDLNTFTGGVAEYSADVLKTQILLTKQFGLTGEEAAGVYKFATLSGKSSSQINDEMVGAFVSMRNMVRGSANFKSTIAEALKVSGQLAMNFKNNPAEITKAIVQAQILGTTLENTRKQGEYLLNFESSIESELKAELLVGQQINLERARAAALMGDQVTVMKELANQGMTLEKFQNMNVIAQKSFAEALGLSADELSEQLRKQKIAQEQGKSLAELTKEEALQAEKRQAIQEKFNIAVEKVQDLIGNLVAGPVGWLLEKLSNMLPVLRTIAAIWGTIYTINKGISIISAINSASINSMISKLPALLGLKSTEAALATETAAATVATAEAATFGAATLWIVGGLAAVMGALAGYSASKVGDIISPADGKTQISTKEGGLFELSPNDDLLAGPGLAKGKASSINTTIDLAPMISAINQVKLSVDRLYNKETSINMDSKKVGTTLTQGSYKVA